MLPTNCAVSGILVASILLLQGATALEWLTDKLDDVQIEGAEANAAAMRQSDVWWKSDVTDPIPDNYPQWYEKVDFAKQPRFDAIALLFIAKIKISVRGKAQATGKRCTAFYISPNTLATAAHCLTDMKVKKDSGHTLIVRQQYDGSTDKDYTDEMARNFERVVVEWIYPKQYKIPRNPGLPWCSQSGLDYAFLKVNRNSYNDAHYQLVSPFETNFNAFDYAAQHSSVVIAGYPDEWRAEMQPATVEGVLHFADDQEFKDEPGVHVGLEFGLKTCDLAGSQITAISKGGAIGSGGSGGPWLISEATLDHHPPVLTGAEKTKRIRWAIGITGWGLGRPAPQIGWPASETFGERQKLSTVSLSAMFTGEFIQNSAAIVNIRNSKTTSMESALKKRKAEHDDDEATPLPLCKKNKA